jgi:hypothetical protein
MAPTIRLFLFVQGLSLVTASLVHRGVLVSGYEHAGAATPEMVIGLVLLAGLVATFMWPAAVRGIGLGVQIFALAGTCLGIVMVAVGVGPHTTADLVYHGALLALLIWGLVWTARAGAGRTIGA